MQGLLKKFLSNNKLGGIHHFTNVMNGQQMEPTKRFHLTIMGLSLAFGAVVGAVISAATDDAKGLAGGVAAGAVVGAMIPAFKAGRCKDRLTS
jgi:uncharacterized membrane protein